MTALTTGTRPEHCAWTRRSVGERPPWPPVRGGRHLRAASSNGIRSSERQLGDPVPLGVAAAADRAREGREVLGPDHHRTAVDRARRRPRCRRPGRRRRRACRTRGTFPGPRGARPAGGRRGGRAPCASRAARARPWPGPRPGVGRGPRGSRPRSARSGRAASDRSRASTVVRRPRCVSQPSIDG